MHMVTLPTACWPRQVIEEVLIIKPIRPALDPFPNKSFVVLYASIQDTHWLLVYSHVIKYPSKRPRVVPIVVCERCCSILGLYLDLEPLNQLNVLCTHSLSFLGP